MGIARWTLALAIVGSAAAWLGAADEAKTVALPRPDTEGGRPLMQVLRDRRASRVFDARALPAQVLANLLWAADGVNRPDGRRTAPSALNGQEIDVYVATADGVFRYDAAAHTLVSVLAEDVRASTGQQEFVAQAPVNLAYVADITRIPTNRFPVSDEDKATWVAAHAGCICQNVYLFCASEGLNVVVRGLVPREELARKLGLRPDQQILLAQTVGYPKP